MSILHSRIRFIEKFFARFNSVFSTNHQSAMFRKFIYGVFADYKRLSLAAIANNTALNYQQLQYFFSESNWSARELNYIRIRLLQNQRATKAVPGRVLVIDDVACPKPHAEKTEGAQVQYCGILDREKNCNVAVASCFASNTKHFPVDFKSYLTITTPNPQNFKSKLDFAKKLISEAIAKGIPFSVVIIDAWHTSTDLIEFAASQNLSLVAEVKNKNSILFTHPQTKQWRYLAGDKIIPLIKEFYPQKLKPVSIPQADGTNKNILTYSFKSKLKDYETDPISAGYRNYGHYPRILCVFQ